MYNYGFNPYQPYQAQVGTQMSQPYQQPQPMSPTQMSGTNGETDNRIWVQGKAAAEAHLMTPNSFVRLWDNDGRTFYEKTTDASGRPNMRTFRYEEIKQETAPFCQGQQNGEDLHSEQIKALEKRIRALEEELHAVSNKSDANDATVYAVPAELPRQSTRGSHEANKQRKD